MSTQRERLNDKTYSSSRDRGRAEHETNDLRDVPRCHCGAPARTDSLYDSVCGQWPLCGSR